MPERDEERRLCAGNILSEDYGDFILDYYVPDRIRTTPENYCAQTVNNRFLIFYVPKREWEPLSYSRVPYPVVPKLYTLQDTTSLTASGITQVRRSALNLTGRGVLIGIIDTGIDYRNRAFRDAAGRSRILSIWDQTIQDGMPPEGFSYGSEYSREQINDALRAEDPYSVVPSRDEDGHGTFLAGVAGGSILEDADFSGAAPEAMLAVVKLKPAKQYLRDFYGVQDDAVVYQENDIMLAASYLGQLRARLRIPLVILCGLGTNQGSHTGTSPLSQVLDMLVQYPAAVAVTPVGNETGLAHHFEGRVSAEGEYEDVEVRVAPEERGFQIELWAQIPDQFAISVQSPGGRREPEFPVRLGRNQLLNFALENTQVDVSYNLLSAKGNSQLITLRFRTPSPGVWTVRVYCVNYLTGRFFMWLPARGLIREDTVFLSPSPDTTLTVPSAAENLLSVGSYNHVTGGIDIRSGRGYTVLGLVKPDLVAPGVDIYGPAPGDAFVRRTGTSISAAHVAGASACLLEWAVTRGERLWVNSNSIRSVLIQGAGRNPNISYPNREWGYGTLDLYGAVQEL